jgi:hypothetical protein
MMFVLKDGDFVTRNPSTSSIWKDAPKTLWLDLHRDDWMHFHLSGGRWYLNMENYIPKNKKKVF